MEDPKQVMQTLAAVGKGGMLVKNPIRTTIPGWTKQRDKAEQMLTRWCEALNFPPSYATKMMDYFDTAPQKFAFHEAGVEYDGSTVIKVYCKVEIGKNKFEEVIKEFTIEELKAS